MWDDQELRDKAINYATYSLPDMGTTDEDVLIRARKILKFLKGEDEVSTRFGNFGHVAGERQTQSQSLPAIQQIGERGMGESGERIYVA